MLISEKIFNMKEKVLSFVKLYFSIYFILFIFPFPLFGFPIIVDNFFVWFGQNIFGLDFVKQVSTGSGDTVFDFVKLSFVLILAAIFSIIFLFTKPSFREKVTSIAIIYGRFFLGCMLLSYGFAKFGDGQFGLPSLFRLNQSIGDMSPMGILWTFMGSSPAYSAFAGICQVIAGFLLLFRKTYVLGALVAFGVMTNIVVLNFCYDVPVKIFSTNLALISLFIIHNNWSQILMFLLGKPSKITFVGFRFNKKWLQITSKVLIVLYILTITVGMSMSRIINTEENVNDKFFAVYKNEIQSNDSLVLTKMIIDDGYAQLFYKNDTIVSWDFKFDEKENTMFFKAADSTKSNIKLHYKFIEDNKIEFSDSEKPLGKFSLTKKGDFELLKRGFNWTSEYPYNR